MSGIFGCIYLKEGFQDSKDICAIAASMEGWGPDGVSTSIKDTAAFGHALLKVTVESLYEKMPLWDDDIKVLFTAAARLDNREELCDIFDIPSSERAQVADGKLMFKAYKKWGENACKYIFGDWSFAAWHSKERRLFLGRDHLGNTGLFYYFKPPLVVFASSPSAILTHPAVTSQLDELKLASNLGLEVPKDSSRTFWKDIYYLPAAHHVTFSGDKRHVDKFWDLANISPLRLSNDASYVEGFLEHFRRAVSVRLNSFRPIGTQLSCGLDSSAVTALAARELKQQNKALVAYTSVPLHSAEKLFPNRITNEWSLANSVAVLYDNVEHIAISSADVTPLAAVRRSLDITKTPLHAAANMTWIISLHEHARKRDIGVLLTGQLGNGGISWSGGIGYIFNLFANHSWRRGLQALTSWKNYHGYSWRRALKSQILRPILLPLRSAYRNFFHPTFYSFPQVDFMKKLGVKAGQMEPQHLDPLTERMLTIIRNGTMVGPISHSFGSYYHMEQRDPTADVRLLEFCMAIPDEQNTFNGGERMMVRRSMEGIVPDGVRWNIVRGMQSADLLYRLDNQHLEVTKQLAQLQYINEVTQYVDIHAMTESWNRMTTSPSAAVTHLAECLMRGFSTAYFLQDNASG